MLFRGQFSCVCILSQQEFPRRSLCAPQGARSAQIAEHRCPHRRMQLTFCTANWVVSHSSGEYLACMQTLDWELAQAELRSTLPNPNLPGPALVGAGPRASNETQKFLPGGCAPPPR